MAIARLPRKIENDANFVVYKGGYKRTIGTTGITLLFSYIYMVYKIIFKIKLAPKNFVKTPISQFRMGKPLSIGKFWPKIVFFFS